jgi:hypothetical protein
MNQGGKADFNPSESSGVTRSQVESRGIMRSQVESSGVARSQVESWSYGVCFSPLVCISDRSATTNTPVYYLLHHGINSTAQ